MTPEQKQRALKALAELAQSEQVEELPAALKMAEVLQELIAEQPASVPDGLETTRFLTDVTTAAGLLAHGRQDKGLARRIGDFANKYRMLAAAPAAPERDPELARDAERYRWLLKQAWFQQAADRFDFTDGGLQNRFEKCMDDFIDAAMNEKGGA